MMKKSWFLMPIMMLLITLTARAEGLKSGSWRFELKTANATVPFIAELHFNKKKLEGKIFNGKETIPLENIVYSQKKLRIPLQTYEITLELVEESPTKLSGLWVRHNKTPKLEIPIIATYGETERFPGKKEKAEVNLSGKWAIDLEESDGAKSQGVAVFEQEDNHFTGSILTSTGDYRYLEGYVSGKEFEAASFDGMFNHVFKGKVSGKKIEAAILANYITKIEGKRDEKAELPDAYAQTQVEGIDFAFPDLKGKKVSLSDPKFKNRPVIITFFGSWCPNCLDEMNYLIPWYKNNKERGVEVVALSFERSVTEAESKRQLMKVQKKHNVPYTMLLAGTSANDKPADKIPGLKNFISFPTTVFLDKKHNVIKVHAGFTGPSTGHFFEKWKTEFNETVNALLK